MKIESIIKRPGGTVIDMDAPKRSYKFAPEDGIHESPHVADVDVQHHASALLRIREGFRLVDGEEVSPGFQRAVTTDPSETLIGSNVHNASYPLSGGETITLGELVQMAFDDSGLTHDGWNDLPDEERYEYIDATLSELQVEGSAPQKPEQVQQEQAQPEPVDEKKAGDESADAAGDDDQEDETEEEAPEQLEQPEQVQQQPEQEQEQAEQHQEPQEEKPAAVTGPSMDMTREDLAELFKKRFGREPSRHLNKTDIINALSEED